MPTKRRRRQEVTPDASPAEAPGEVLELSEETGPSLSVFDASGDTRVRCLWRDPQRQKWTTHGYLPPSTTEEDILKLFGGGEYMLQLLVQSPEGKEVIKQTRRLKLVGAHRIPANLPGIHEPPPGASTNGAQTPEVGTLDGSSPVQMLNTALVGSVIDLLKTLKTPPAPAPVAPQLPWGEILTVVVGPLMLKLVDKRNDKSEILEMMKQLKEMIPPSSANAPVSNTVTDMVKGIKELMGLKDIVEGREAPPDPETAMWGAAMKAMELIAPKLGGATQPQPPAAAALPPGAQPGMPRWKLMLLAQRSRLIQAASFGLAADTAAETALTFLPPQMHGILTEFLALPDHVEITMQTIPELREFATWTAEFMEELRSQFMGEEEEDAEEGQERETQSS